MAGLTEILDDTIAALETMRRAGVTHVEVSPATLRELARPVALPAPPAMAASLPGAVAPASAPAPTREPGEVAAGLAALQTRVAACQLCGELAPTRTQTVFGGGNPLAELMFIGEAPGHDEDVAGEPFVGRAGQLLTKIIQAMGLTRHEVYIANALKCRPPDNRTPEPDEIANCRPFLLAQIDQVRPRVIVALGASALRALVETQTGITRLRGKWLTFRGIPMMPTFHPSYLLRNPSAKREVWDDMQAVIAKLGREIPAASRKPAAR